MGQFAAMVSAAIGRPLPEIRLELPALPPATVQVDVHVPKQPAPVVHVPAAAAPVVNVTLPPRKTITHIERDKEGNLLRATQEDHPL